MQSIEQNGNNNMTEEIETCAYCTDGIVQEICGTCNGSGEGFFDGSTCSSCKGSGIELEYCDCQRGDERLTEEIF